MVVVAAEFAEDFRNPINDIESRLGFRVLEVADAGVTVEVWRGTRDVEAADGEPRTEACRTFGVAPSSFSMTPNSFVEKLTGDAFVEVDAVRPLALLLPKAEPEVLLVGEGTAEVRLEMRGILVGVSLGRPETELRSDDKGSLLSFKV